MKSALNAMLLMVGLLPCVVLAAGGEEEFDDLHKLTSGKTAVDNLPTEKLSDRAFEALMEEMYPTTPEQLKMIQDKEKEFNNVIYDNKEPEALTDIIQVSTKPGAKPVHIFVAPFHGSSAESVGLNSAQ